MSRTQAQRDAEKRHKAKKKAAGICVDCALPATHGLRCDDHAAAVALRTREADARRAGRHGERDRVPTFEDFCRLEDER